MLQLLGLIRFSYPTPGGLQIGFDDIDDLKAYLWSKERIEQRFAFFEHVCLPSLRAQTDPNFRIALLTGEDMPTDHVRRLAELIEDIPQIVTCPLPPLKQLPAAEMAIKRIKTQEGDFAAHFRLDDDDAVAVDFVADVRKRFAGFSGMMDSNPRISLDYNHGYVLSASPTSPLGRVVHQRQWTPGQVVFLPRPNFRTIMHFPHHKLDRNMPTITLPNPLMFVRSMNSFNDSGTSDFPKQLPELKDKDRETLKQRFNISVNDFFQAARSLF